MSKLTEALNRLVDNQGLQRKIAAGLGVSDVAKRADILSERWAQKNNMSTSARDTLRHVLLGGMVQPTSKDFIGANISQIVNPAMGKAIAASLINRREGNVVTGKGVNTESKIDVNNNDYGKMLRAEFTDEDQFIKEATKRVTSVYRGKQVAENGMRIQRSTAGMSSRLDATVTGLPLERQ